MAEFIATMAAKPRYNCQQKRAYRYDTNFKKNKTQASYSKSNLQNQNTQEVGENRNEERETYRLRDFNYLWYGATVEAAETWQKGQSS